jgi:single-strand DNA-binding protein
MYNKVILVGNLTRDIDLRYTQSGAVIANTAIATSRKYTSNGERKEDVCFVDITFFGKSGEIANQYLRKGSKILVEGRLNFDQWVDQNGQKRSKHSVIVEVMQMLDSKGDNTGNGNYNNQQAPQQQGGYQAPQQPQQQTQQSYQAPQQQQQQSYQAPQQGYNNQAQQSRPMPSPTEIPEIDINEDEIPF